MTLNEFIKLNEGIHDPGLFKAIIMLGSPGAGKSYIIDKAIKSPEWKIINPDATYERYMKKEGLSVDSRKLSDYEMMDSFDIHDEASKLTSKKAVFAIEGRLPIVIDKTGRVVEDVLKVKNQLEKIGYEVIAVYVKVSEKTALKRNIERKRTADLPYVKDAYKNVVKNIPTFKKAFGNNFLEIDNEKPVEFTKIWVNINKWMKKPVTNSKAKEWKEHELKKIRRS